MNFLSLIKRNLIFKFKNKTNIDNHSFSPKSSLDQIFRFYNTDKSQKVHGFSIFYTKHFKRFINKKINFLEIGSATGASASSFVHYLKKSNAFCIDVNLSLVKFTSKKINYFGLNSSNKKMLNKFLNKIKLSHSVKKFDFIIDDGSHILSDQLFSLNFFYKYINSGGFYIIEDYKFPDYFDEYRDIDNITIDKLLKNIDSKSKIKTKIVDKKTINEIRKSKIYRYKGNSKISNIVFIKKL